MPAQIPAHDWDVSPGEAVSLQKELRSAIVLSDLPRPIQYVAGADVSFNKFEDDIYAVIIVLEYGSMKMVARSAVKDKMDFPYIPGLLSFREIPSLMKAWQMLPLRPDVVVVDGHGIAHPRSMGIAAHFGLVAGVPSIGCAKKLLTGKFEEPGLEKGDFSPIKKQEKVIGFALRTKYKVKPMLVSPGHLCSMDDSLQVALHCARGYRLPEPTRLAHLTVNQLRKGEIGEGAVLF